MGIPPFLGTQEATRARMKKTGVLFGKLTDKKQHPILSLLLLGKKAPPNHLQKRKKTEERSEV